MQKEKKKKTPQGTVRVRKPPVLKTPVTPLRTKQCPPNLADQPLVERKKIKLDGDVPPD
jgi:hypothetical protein